MWGLETEYTKRELHVLYCFSVDISDKIWSICYTQNFHLAHEKKVMQILLFNYFFPLSNNLFTLQKHEREVGLYFHQKIFEPFKVFDMGYKKAQMPFHFLLQMCSGEISVDLLWKKGFLRTWWIYLPFFLCICLCLPFIENKLST